MTSITVNIDDCQANEIEALAKETRSSKSQIIRDAIAAFLQKKEDKKNKSPLLKYAGILKNHDVDGLKYQQRIRSEWDK